MLEVIPRLLVYLLAAAFAPRAFTADVNGFFETARHLSWTHLPYRDFLWEYPPLTTVALVLGPLSGGNRVVYVGVFVTVMIGLEFACLAILRARRPQHAAAMTRFWSLTMIPLGACAYFRLDFVSVFIATLALAQILDGRRAGVLIAAGFATKVWPVLYAGPLLALKRRADVFVALLASAGVLLVWYVFSPDGIAAFIAYRKGAGFEIESVPGALLLLSGRGTSFQFGSAVVSDAGWEWVQVALLVLLGLIFAASLLRMARHRTNVVAMLGALVLTLMLTSRILSPQYLTWLAPNVVLLWPEARRQGWLFGIAVMLTLAALLGYASASAGAFVPVLLINLRNAVLIGLAVELFRLGCVPHAD
jgi:hypothetical protein